MAMPALPPPFRFLLRHAAIGFGLAGLFTLALLWADPDGLGTLLLSAAGNPWPILLLWFFLGLTFGSVQIGTAIMLLEEPPSSDRDGPGI